MTTSSAKLRPCLESYVIELVTSGRYGSRSEALREGVRLVEEREKRLAALDGAIARGVADVEAGRTHTLDEVRQECAPGTARPDGRSGGQIEGDVVQVLHVLHGAQDFEALLFPRP